MENHNNPRANSYDDQQLVSETSLGRNCEKKDDAASGNQTETFTVKVSQSQNSRKRKMSQSSCDPGKQKHDLFFLLLLISTSRQGWLGVIVRTLKSRFFYRTCCRLKCSSAILHSLLLCTQILIPDCTH